MSWTITNSITTVKRIFNIFSINKNRETVLYNPEVVQIPDS